MSNDQSARIRQLRAFAEQFREKARATMLFEYIELMKRSAFDLDQMADEMEMQLGLGIAAEKAAKLRLVSAD